MWEQAQCSPANTRNPCIPCSRHQLLCMGDCQDEDADGLGRVLLGRVFPSLSVSRILPSFSLWYEVIICRQL